MVAGALGVGAQELASLFGEEGEPIVLGILVFLLGIYTHLMLHFTSHFPTRWTNKEDKINLGSYTG